MNATHKMIVGSLATVLSLGVASGTAWAQDTQGNLKLGNKSKVETQHKAKSAGGAEMKTEGQAGGGMKAEGTTRTKGETGSRTKAESNSQIKGEGQKAETKAGAKSDRKGQMKAEESGSMKKGEGSHAEMKSETGKSDKAASGSDRTMKNSESTKTGEAQSHGTSNEKTGSVRKNGGVNVNVTTEQKTEIRQVIKTEDVQPVEHVTFHVDVGTSIPHSVHLHRLPPRIVKIVPAYEDYEYFVLADGRIVIVDPSSYDIVYILA